MAVKEKIRIRLQSYDAQLIDAAAEKIVDPMGVGDAFIAAYIHAHQKWGDKNQYCLDFSMSASAIKNTVPGDQNLVTEEEIINNMTSSGGRIQR